LRGEHNVQNALSALAAAHHAGVPLPLALEALSRFQGVRRRLEVKGVVRGVTVYDDFAHHPTAIAATLRALRGKGRLIAVVEPRSNTMRLGVHREGLAPALADADEVVLYQPPDLAWSLEEVARRLPRAQVFSDLQDLVAHLAAQAIPGDQVVCMSNGAFGGIHDLLLEALGG
ncbi:MAG: UDP-N-acetylmuramate:L-alanyl-gamma-D-glutamyl-meso-diaminopimelate ligase, partial [Gammaproteobacteria bacterium]